MSLISQRNRTAARDIGVGSAYTAVLAVGGVVGERGIHASVRDAWENAAPEDVEIALCDPKRSEPIRREDATLMLQRQAQAGRIRAHSK